MTNKILEYAGVVIVALLAVWFLFGGHVSQPKGVTGLGSLDLTPSSSSGDTYGIRLNGIQLFDVNGNGSTTGNFSTNGNLFANGTLDVNGSSSFGVVNGVDPGNITGIRCVNQNVDPPNLGAGVNTSTVDTAITLAGPSSTVVGWAMFNAATSSSPLVQTYVYPSGTATSAVATVVFFAAPSSTPVAGTNLPSGVLTTCVLQK